MKHVIIGVLLIGFLGVHNATAQKKEFREQIKKELSFENKDTENSLVLKNFFGSISVEGYEGDVIQLEIQKTITAENEADLEVGKQELELKIVRSDTKIIIHPDAPYIEFKEGHLNFNWCNKSEAPVYGHNLDFKVKIPKNIKLDVSTVNDGEVIVKNTETTFIKANNINGGIELENVTGQTRVHAINGEVNISYRKNPKESSSYYSLNGDINIRYHKDLSAEIAFKSMNGELFTDFDIEGQYAKTSKKVSGKGDEAKFRYEAKPVVQIGKGELSHNFETLNGNVILKKI